MRFVTHRPAAPLARFVRHLWISHADPREPVDGVQFPEGGAAVLFSLGAPQGLVDGAGGGVTWHQGSWISGERQRPFRLTAPHGAHLVGIHFRPGGAYAFLRAPLSEVTGRVLDLRHFWPRAEELRERLAGAPGDAERFRLLEHTLLERWIEERARGDEVVRLALERLGARGSGGSVGAVATALGIGPRRLLRTFGARVGLGPKALQRVLRFQRLIRLLDRGAAPDWAGLAVRCGYFDQAHLIRDFRALSGVTPGAYLRRRSGDPNFALGE